MRFPSDKRRRARLLVAAVAVLALVGLLVELLLPYRGYPESTTVLIEQGMGRKAIATRLASVGVLRHRLPFLLYSYLRRGTSLKAGEYSFTYPLSPVAVFGKLARGEVHLYALTVPEGHSMFDIAEAVEDLRLATADAFLEAARDPAPIADLAPNATSLEGYLYPDTYWFARPASPRDMVRQMVGRFRQVWASLEPLRTSAENPYQVKLGPAEIVTLASLVEKETGVPTERGLIAAVFYNRLRRRLPLGCDPTVIYAARLAGRYDGVINVSDLQRDSLYNTYLHRGLPPGPIANPGRASLEAVIHPPWSNYLYFVSNTEGGHFFTRSAAEHARNVARYRRLRAAKEKAIRAGSER
ncbi:MAG: endolytic transglycosylase MltG [Acidobacteria bacterium]|nr:endolytic transglycosylase MltG [Acidobacteriota bacterium]